MKITIQREIDHHFFPKEKACRVVGE